MQTKHAKFAREHGALILNYYWYKSTSNFTVIDIGLYNSTSNFTLINIGPHTESTPNIKSKFHLVRLEKKNLPTATFAYK